MMSKAMIEHIIRQEELAALGYLGDGSYIQQKRAKHIDYYNRRPYGDEKPGRSSYVSPDLYNVIESVLPPFLQFFDQSQYLPNFIPSSPQFKEEAEQKTIYCQAMYEMSGGIRLLENAAKESFLQYTGWFKTIHFSETKTKFEIFDDLTEEELAFKKLENKGKIVEEEKNDDGTYTIRVEVEFEHNYEKIVEIPADEGIISRHDRDFKNPRFIGQRTPKTRSELVKMGFDKKLVKELQDHHSWQTPSSRARTFDLNVSEETAVRDWHDSQTELMLGEYYLYLDVDEDGIGEYYQVFFCNDKLLRKTRVEKHPYHIYVANPLPNRAIGTCIAEAVCPIQFWRSHLIRQMNDNIWFTNYNRMLVNDLVELDDVLSPKPGGVIRVDGQMPVQQAMMPLVTQSQVDVILQAIQLSDTERERTSGVTDYNQGMDSESLNKTATGFTGIRDMSMMRVEKYAMHMREVLKSVFMSIVENAMKYTNKNSKIILDANGEPIDPRSWVDQEHTCDINIGVGEGDRMARSNMLNMILERQMMFMQNGSVMADEVKLYKTLDELLFYSNLNGAEGYFNNPEKAPEKLQAENEIMQKQLAELEQIATQRNVLQEVEQTKVQGKLAEAQMRLQAEQASLEQKERFKQAELNMKDDHFEMDKNIEITKLEIDAQKDFEGGLNSAN